jgi:threonine/homoserine/homoserine lactone efflux protein
MVTMFILGLLWIVIFYLAGSQVPVMQDLSNLVNVLVGFVFIGIGFALATRWR